jgi:hypothetical protein
MGTVFPHAVPIATAASSPVPDRERLRARSTRSPKGLTWTTVIGFPVRQQTIQDMFTLVIEREEQKQISRRAATFTLSRMQEVLECDFTQDEIVSEIHQCSTRADWFKIYWPSGLALVFVLLLVLEAWAVALVSIALIGIGVMVYRWNAERRTVRLLYDVDDPAAMARFAVASAAGMARRIFASTTTKSCRFFVAGN